MLGVPCVASEKYLNILISAGYTVIMVDQITSPPYPKRAVTAIYSPGTYFNNTSKYDSNNIVCLYIEDEIQKSGGILTCVGMSSIDLSTGECAINEVYSTNMDDKYAMDEAYRFLITYNPKEVIIFRKELKNISVKKDVIISYLELDDKTCHYFNTIEKNYLKISFQNEFLGKIYKDCGMLSPIEFIDIEKTPYALVSFICLLDFAYKHNDDLICNINKPKNFSNGTHLILGNNAIYQLNILENSLLENNNNKFRSVFDVINNCSTAMGKRFLKTTLCQPSNDFDEINLRYDCIDEIIKQDLYLKLETCLNSILDIQRLSRKITLNSMHPFELANLLESFNRIEEIVKLISTTNFLSKQIPNKKYLNLLTEFLKEANSMFDINELRKYHIKEITGSFFNKGHFKNIDELEMKIVNNIEFMENLCKTLSKYIEDKSYFKKNKKDDSPNEESIINDNKIYLKKNKREGYFLQLTKLRAKSLENNIKNLKKIKIDDNFEINPKDLEFKELSKGNTKIFFNKIIDNNDKKKEDDDVYKLKDNLINIVRNKYIEILTTYNDKYMLMFKEIAQFISKIDFLKAGAKTAKLYKYCKPKILINKNKDSKNGFLKAVKLRHPIVERIRTDVEYIPHDISIGKPPNYKEGDNIIEGMLVMGLNSCGKSTIMKSIGLSIILAQSGLYVPAESYEYCPYESLYARITGNDNIFKGLSSFALEMTELRAIMRRAGPKTLVIGDEVCRGTEHISGNAIVATTLINLAKSGSSFIFATHLHEIANMQRIKELKNLKTFHLTVQYNAEKDILIFDRKLKEGPGESIYGLTVAKYIIKDTEFMKLAQEIKNDLLKIPNELLNSKTSHFNSEVHLHECQICGKKNTTEMNSGILDVHHIYNQKDCTDGFINVKPHLLMNEKLNLCVLCKECHYKAHHDQVVIDGYIDTSEGRILNFKFINKKNPIKLLPNAK